MKLATLFSIIVTAAVASTANADGIARRQVDPSEVPPFGVVPGIDCAGDGACDGVYGPDGHPVAIPCSCPPDSQTFIDSLNANVDAGHVINNPDIAVRWPAGSGKAPQQARMEALIDTLQNLYGPGVGCPVESTNFGIIEQYVNSLPAACQRL